MKIAATDEEAKAEAAAPAIVDIDVQANQILRYAAQFNFVRFFCVRFWWSPLFVRIFVVVFLPLVALLSWRTAFLFYTLIFFNVFHSYVPYLLFTVPCLWLRQ